MAKRPDKNRRSAKARKSRKAPELLENPDLLTYGQAARFLGIKQATLEVWVQRGTEDVPVVRLGRLVRFRRASLERWLSSRERGGPQFVPQATVAAPQVAEAR